MLQDIVTVFTRELKEILQMRGTKRSGWINVLVVIGIMGVYMPLMSGREWVTNLLNPISFAWLPLFLVIGVVADSFAGERERHTLETLLASRLPDRAILLGKMSAAVLYSFSIGISGLLVGALALNIVHPEEGIRFYPLNTFASLLALNFLAPLLLAGLGVLVSLKAQTARQAYQRISIVLLILWVLPNLALIAVPESLRSQVALQLGGLDYWSILFGVIAIMAGVDALLVWICLKRFKRTRLALIL